MCFGGANHGCDSSGGVAMALLVVCFLQWVCDVEGFRVCSDVVRMRVLECLTHCWVGCVILVVCDVPLVGSVSQGGGYVVFSVWGCLEV